MLQILGAIFVKVPPTPPCGCGALALQILGVILSNVPPPPLWLWTAGAGEAQGAPLALSRLRRTRGAPGAPQERPRALNRRICSQPGGASAPPL